jgi:xanthine dehydrogenase molybdenum-binding subunit
MMADALGRDRLELRLQNVVRPGDSLPSGEPVRDPSGLEVMERLGEISDWKRTKPAASRPNLAVGRGMAYGHRHIGAGETNVELVVEADGSLRLICSVRDQGVGANTMHTMVAAEIIGIAPERIRIDSRGTDGPYDEGVRAGRGVHIEGRAVANAATALIALLRTKAAAHWNVALDQTEWRNGTVHHLGSKQQLGLADMARLFSDEPLRAGGHFKAGKSDYYDFQAIIADVEVDTETGEVRVRQLYYVLDVTSVINPMIHQGQIEGGIIQGLGHTLMEQLVIEDGRVVNLHLGDYKIPSIGDVPPLTISLVKSKEGPGIFNAKSVAEVGISIVAPAIANAVFDATGVRIHDLPITAEKILNGLQARQPAA